MYVSNSTSTSNVQDPTSKEQNTGATSVEFSLSDYENKDPREITFTEYKNLTKEDIEKLYPKEEVPEQYEKAISLHTKANGTHDEILNEVLFDKEIANEGSKFEKRLSHMIDFMMVHQEMLVRLELAIDQVDQYIKDNNIKFEGDNSKELRSQYLQVLAKVEKELTVPEDRKIISKDELFEVFKNNKLGAEANIEFNKYTPEDEQYQYYQAMFIYEKSIVDEYERRVAQKESSLASHQSNQSAAHAIAQAQQQKDQEQETQKTQQTTNGSELIQAKESRKEYYERLKKIVEDIWSVMVTGLTVDELEVLKEALAKLEGLKEKDDPESEEEIAALIKQLEKIVLAYQKRINGVAITEADDENENKEEKETQGDPIENKINDLSKAIEDILSGRYKDKAEQKEGDNVEQLSSKDSFIAELMKQGFSENEAKQRADIYKNTGLFSSYNSLGNIFDTELFGVGFTANPTYKKALMDAFSQMDTDQLESMATQLRTRYEIDMEELKKQIPENLQVSDAMLHGFDDYMGYQFGTPDKVFGMFDKMMEQATMVQRLTGEDQSEIIDGVNKVLTAYAQNLTLSTRGSLF